MRLENENARADRAEHEHEHEQTVFFIIYILYSSFWNQIKNKIFNCYWFFVRNVNIWSNGCEYIIVPSKVEGLIMST